MSPLLKKGLLGLGVVVLGGGAYAYSYVQDLGSIAAGYVSQTLCTNVLIVGREQAQVEAQDLARDQRSLTTSIIGDNWVETTASIGPIRVTTTSVHRPGLGCSNVAGLPVEDVRQIQRQGPPVSKSAPVDSFEVGSHPDVNGDQLRVAIDRAFTETADSVYEKKNTRATLVFYDGQLIAERYADGFNGTTPLRGMSMTKSVTSALAGILVGQGKLDIHKAAGIAGWSDAEDSRAQLTTHHLLKMIGGFDYQEAYETNPRSTLSMMLMTQPDMASYAAEIPTFTSPGKNWDYQTTHSVLLAKVVRNTINDDQAYFRFPQEQLFDRIGMHNSHMQADASGTFTGGAFMFASARDWLRFGLLYLNDGVHKGQRILPEGWVEYTRTASNASLEKRPYGAQFWLNNPAEKQLFPGLPDDAYAAQGHYGQYVVIVPSMKLVVVRMGMTFDKGAFDKNSFLNDVVAAMPQSGQNRVN